MIAVLIRESSYPIFVEFEVRDDRAGIEVAEINNSWPRLPPAGVANVRKALRKCDTFAITKGLFAL